MIFQICKLFFEVVIFDFSFNLNADCSTQCIWAWFIRKGVWNQNQWKPSFHGGKSSASSLGNSSQKIYLLLEILFIHISLNCISCMQLKYHETGKEKVCLPQVGQWNMMNKVAFLVYVKFTVLFLFFLGEMKMPIPISQLVFESDLWFSRAQKMINGMTVSRWACINFSRSVQESVARGFCNELVQMCQVSGMVEIPSFLYVLSFFCVHMFVYCIFII